MEFLTTFDLLAMNGLVADFPAGWLRRMAVCGRPVTYAPGDRLCREDGPADRLWLIHNGDVMVDLHVPGRGDVAVELLVPGSVIGWEALTPPFRWGFGAAAVQEVDAVELRAAAVRGFLGDDPDLGRAFYARLLARVGGALPPSPAGRSRDASRGLPALPGPRTGPPPAAPRRDPLRRPATSRSPRTRVPAGRPPGPERPVDPSPPPDPRPASRRAPPVGGPPCRRRNPAPARRRPSR
ncbi:hypothetical protein GCM10010109_89940 [Actinoplanes campanulatus]|nr:hypothetical protein GCM10010109_89940 [Actinoplanes campanulatus]GID42083.1 hypothetical protein Aca09nite_85890 [Actinoplanes campanulatus]